MAATKTFSLARCMFSRCSPPSGATTRRCSPSWTRSPAPSSSFFPTSRTTSRRLSRDTEYMENGFVLSRGTNMAIAFETMLKLQGETNYVKMKGLRRAPISGMARSRRWTRGHLRHPLRAGGTRVRELQGDACEALDDIGAEVILVSDNEGGRRRPGCSPSSFRKLGCDCVSPFLFAVFAQMFACKLTAVKDVTRRAQKSEQGYHYEVSRI